MTSGQETPVLLRPLSRRAVLLAGWALGGLSLLFLQAIIRLGARGLETVTAGLDPREWVALAVLVPAFVYGEGVRGIQRGFAPLVASRLHRLLNGRQPLWHVFAPLYLLALVGAPARTMARAWLGVSAIVAAVLIVRAFPEPWRGIVDLAVVAALAWGLVAVIVRAIRSLRVRAEDQAGRAAGSSH